MDTKHLSYFKVENFRRFDSLEVDDIGQFNLIVGDNNVGKTSLLEALLFDDENYNQCLRNFNTMLSVIRNLDFDNDDDEKVNYFDFIVNNNKKILYYFSYNNEAEVNEFLVSRRLKTDLSKAEVEGLSGYFILNKNEQYLIEFTLNGKSTLKFLYDMNDDNTVGYAPFISFNKVYGEDLSNFFSKISISNFKFEELKATLRYFIPNLTSIEINNAIVKSQSLLILRESDKDSIQPLLQYGDGFIKIFRCLLEIEYCENKRLMIDEIDTGVHYSRMKEFLKKVLQTAKNKNVQIFATTHSKECLQYYTEALKELGYEKDGRVIKIADTKSGIKAYSSRYSEFENSLFAESEIR